MPKSIANMEGLQRANLVKHLHSLRGRSTSAIPYAMGVASKYAALRKAGSGTVLEVIILLAVARALVRFFPFRFWRSALGSLDQCLTAESRLEAIDIERAEQIGDLVTRVARRMPFNAVCLPQAMACRWMLSRRGLSCRVMFGVNRSGPRDQIASHAWVMCGEVCLTGKNQRDNFLALTNPAGM